MSNTFDPSNVVDRAALRTRLKGNQERWPATVSNEDVFALLSYVDRLEVERTRILDDVRRFAVSLQRQP
jgi:hypothetical protein